VPLNQKLKGVFPFVLGVFLDGFGVGHFGISLFIIPMYGGEGIPTKILQDIPKEKLFSYIKIP